MFEISTIIPNTSATPTRNSKIAVGLNFGPLPNTRRLYRSSRFRCNFLPQLLQRDFTLSFRSPQSTQLTYKCAPHLVQVLPPPAFKCSHLAQRTALRGDFSALPPGCSYFLELIIYQVLNLRPGDQLLREIVQFDR